MRIQPLQNRVLVLPTPVDDITKKGIIIPTSSKERPSMGTVVAVGIGKKDDPLMVKVGNTVMYSKHAGFPVEDQGKTYLMMKEADDIYAIIKD